MKYFLLIQLTLDSAPDFYADYPTLDSAIDALTTLSAEHPTFGFLILPVSNHYKKSLTLHDPIAY